MLEETRIVSKRLHDRPEDSWTIDAAVATGCYEVLREVLAAGDPASIQDHVMKSGLRGRGGANFGCGQKWSFLPQGVFPRYLVVNGDEGEPSTFKDRMLIERDPHQLIEGIVISVYAISCNLVFIYVRGEFAAGIRPLDAGDSRRARARVPRSEHSRVGIRSRLGRAPGRGRP